MACRSNNGRGARAPSLSLSQDRGQLLWCTWWGEGGAGRHINTHSSRFNDVKGLVGGKEAGLIIPNTLWSITAQILNHMIVDVKCLEISFQTFFPPPYISKATIASEMMQRHQKCE